MKTKLQMFVMLATLLFMEAAGSDSAIAQSTTAMDLLKRSMALYPTLSSYADTGTVTKEAPGLVDRWRFTTRFRAPLDFYFDFQSVSSTSAGLTSNVNAQRIVLWMTNGELQSFNQQLHTHDTIPRTGNQPAVLQNTGAATMGTSMLIPSLIFVKANLPGTLNQIQQASDAGFEAVSGHRCHKIIGMAAQFYPSGQMTNVRQVTVWIDAETLLVRKVFEDTPKGYPIGSYSKLTVTIDPQINTKLEDKQFQFTVPAATH